MHVVGRGDHHGFDVLSSFEPDTIILKPLGSRKRLGRVRGLAPIHVAERDEVLALEVVEHAADLAGHTDATDVKLLARRRPALAQNMARKDFETDGRCGGPFEELAALHHGLDGWTQVGAGCFTGRQPGKRAALRTGQPQPAREYSLSDNREDTHHAENLGKQTLRCDCVARVGRRSSNERGDPR